MKNLTLIGTSHIAQQSLDDVKEAIGTGQYDIVALELDAPRLQALRSKQKTEVSYRDIRRIGVKGYLFALFGAWGERKLGELVGVKPGSEMLMAYKLARKNGLQVALIDQEIEVTLRKFSEQFTWREKFRFFWDVVKGVFKREKIEFDLTKVPPKELIEKLVGRVKDRYPNLYKVLVTERNHVMARNLAMLMKQYPDKRVLAIIGAGHEEELLELVRKEMGKQEPSITFSYHLGTKKSST